MEPNRKYKDSVFVTLFNDPGRLRELYNALAGTSYDESVKITINTLEDTVFMGRINDLSFTIDDKVVVLIEHQSTINPNMPVRLLLYIARIYETLIDSKKIYTGARIAIPRPEFIVLYNGLDAYPDKTTLRLSNHFEKRANHDSIDLELAVTVYNINKGRNPAVEARCRWLEGYAALVAKVREYEKEGLELKPALIKAVRWCIRRRILGEFLKSRGSEVVNMLFAEWDWDVAKEVWYEDGQRDGLEQGMKQGLEQGLEQGMERGLEKGARQSRLEIARNLRYLGLPPERIAQSTGLSMEEIAGLLP